MITSKEGGKARDKAQKLPASVESLSILQERWLFLVMDLIVGGQLFQARRNCELHVHVPVW